MQVSQVLSPHRQMKDENKGELGRIRGYIAYKIEFMLRLVAEYLNRF